MDPMEAVLLRALVDAVLADWAWHLDHGDYAAVAELFTEDARFVTGAVELRGRSAIEHRYTERERVRTTRHTYSGLRVSVADEGYDPDTGHPPAQLRALSTWVSYAVNGPAPVDDVWRLPGRRLPRRADLVHRRALPDQRAAHHPGLPRPVPRPGLTVTSRGPREVALPDGGELIAEEAAPALPSS